MKPAAAWALAPAALVLAALTLAALTLLRLVLATTIPLAPDEAYYWIWSRALAPGYLDHPPMVALWIRLGTLLAGQTALGVRLLGPLSAAIGSCLLADAADRLFPGRHAGIVAAGLFNATLLLGVGAVIMTPDTPLLFFWTATIWALVRVQRHPGWLLAAGGLAGLALVSKYTAAFLWPGILLWLLWVPSLRPWLRRPWPWAGAALGLLLFVPVLWWNSQHAWAGLLRQGGRVGDWRPARAIGFLGELVGGQIGLATPLIAVLCVAGLVLACRRTWQQRDPASTLLAALTLPAVLVFVQHAIGDRVQGNWPAILYPAACIAAAALTGPRWQRLRIPAMALGFAITLLVCWQAATASLPIPGRLDPIARQVRGWDQFARSLEDLRRQAGVVRIASDQYAIASELAWHLPSTVPVLGIDPRWGLTALGAGRVGVEPVLLVRPARSGPPNPADWPNSQPLAAITRGPESDMVFLVYGRAGLLATRLPHR